MSVAIWNCYSWSLDVCSNVKYAILDHYMSVAMWNCNSWPLHISWNMKLHFWPLDVRSNVKLPFVTTTCQYWWQVDLISRSRGISAKFEHILTTRCQYHLDPLAMVGLSGKFGVAVFKASILYSLEGPLAKVGLSAKFGVAVFKSSILDSLGLVHWP